MIFCSNIAHTRHSYILNMLQQLPPQTRAQASQCGFKAALLDCPAPCPVFTWLNSPSSLQSPVGTPTECDLDIITPCANPLPEHWNNMSKFWAYSSLYPQPIYAEWPTDQVTNSSDNEPQNSCRINVTLHSHYSEFSCSLTIKNRLTHTSRYRCIHGQRALCLISACRRSEAVLQIVLRDASCKDWALQTVAVLRAREF